MLHVTAPIQFVESAWARGPRRPNKPQSQNNPKASPSGSPLVAPHPQPTRYAGLPSQAAPVQIPASQPGPVHVPTSQAAPVQVPASQPGPVQLPPSQAGPVQVPAQPGPVQLPPSQAAPVHWLAMHSGPTQTPASQPGAFPKPSAGQLALTPSQTSATSQEDAAARQLTWLGRTEHTPSTAAPALREQA
jgi:hypothetical protein